MDKLKNLSAEFIIILAMVILVSILITCLIWVIRQKWKKYRNSRLEREGDASLELQQKRASF